MNAIDRARAARLDTALARRDADIRDADRRALAACEKAGYRFRTVAEALAFQRAEREAARVNAARVAMRADLAARRSA